MDHTLSARNQVPAQQHPLASLCWQKPDLGFLVPAQRHNQECAFAANLCLVQFRFTCCVISPCICGPSLQWLGPLHSKSSCSRRFSLFYKIPHFSNFHRFLCFAPTCPCFQVFAPSSLGFSFLFSESPSLVQAQGCRFLGRRPQQASPWCVGGAPLPLCLLCSRFVS